MRTLGYSTLLLATSLVVAPACSKKDETSDAAAKADGGKEASKEETAKTGDTPAGDAKPADAQPTPEGGLAGAAGGSAQLAAGGFPSAISLVPEQAQFVLGISPKGITGSPIYAMMAKELDNDPEFQKALSAFKDCGLDPATFESVVVGVSMDENFVAVITGAGIGEDKNASCVIKNIQKQAGDSQLAEVVNQNGKKLIQFTDGRAYLVDARTLAITTTAWEGTVDGLVGGTGTPAATGSKKDLFAKVDGSATIWGVADVPAELAGMAALFGAPSEFSSIKQVTGSVDLSSGAAVKMLAGFTSEATATKVTTQLQAMLAEAAKAAPAELAPMIGTVKIASAGADMTMSMSASMDDITKAQAAQL
jgi:hypothetical protein